MSEPATYLIQVDKSNNLSNDQVNGFPLVPARATVASTGQSSAHQRDLRLVSDTEVLAHDAPEATVPAHTGVTARHQ